MAYVFPAAVLGERFLVTAFGNSLENVIINTWWYRLAIINTPKLKNEAMDELENMFSGTGAVMEKFLLTQPGNYTLESIWVQPIRPLRYVKQVYPKNLIGTSTQPGETNNLQGTIVRRGSTATRKSIGALRLLLPTSVAVVNDGLIEAAHKTKMANLCTEMVKSLTPPSNNVYTPVIDNGINLIDYTDIGECFPQETVRVLRRRTLRIGV